MALTDREKEREAELEGTMYTNCLLLGLDPVVLGSPTSPRVGLSNLRLGEELLHFLLSSLRGPAQSAKDFDKVWLIFDSAQSRELRKIVQGIISEVEQQGALPRSHSRVSSLAACCGPRLVDTCAMLNPMSDEFIERLAKKAEVYFKGKKGLDEEEEEIVANGLQHMNEEAFLAFRNYTAENDLVEGFEYRFGEVLHHCSIVEEYWKVYRHYNFTVKMKKNDEDSWTSELYFAEAKQVHGAKYYFCSRLLPTDAA